MGYNTVAVILNDGLHVLDEDKGFGARVHAAVLGWWHRDRDRLACDADAVVERENGSRSVFGSVLKVIGQAHADTEQVVIVSRNSGQRAEDATNLGWYALDVMKACLERHGYTVTKRRKPKAAA